jgi:hypothetical protein
MHQKMLSDRVSPGLVDDRPDFRWDKMCSACEGGKKRLQAFLDPMVQTFCGTTQDLVHGWQTILRACVSVCRRAPNLSGHLQLGGVSTAEMHLHAMWVERLGRTYILTNITTANLLLSNFIYR